MDSEQTLLTPATPTSYSPDYIAHVQDAIFNAPNQGGMVEALAGKCSFISVRY